MDDQSKFDAWRRALKACALGQPRGTGWGGRWEEGSGWVFVAQPLSSVWLFATPWTAARRASLSITSSRSLLKLMSIESMMPSNHLILHHPLLLLPSIFPSIRVFSNESALHIRWPKYWSFSLSISPSNEYSGLISFRMNWLDLLAVQGTLNSLLQHHSSKISILWHSAFFMVQLSHPYITTGKTIALIIWTFVSKWCFWIVVLEKTLQSPLDSKEIKPVNPKGNQPWNIHWEDWY